MTTGIQIVQGFQGDISYILQFDGVLIDLTDTIIKFNFTDRVGKNRRSINCKQGTTPGEVLIPFTKNDSSTYGEFYGEFVVKTFTGTDIYPINNYIIVRIRQGI